MKVALLLALSACGFPRPDGVGDQPLDAATIDSRAPEPDAPPIPTGASLTNFRVLQSLNPALSHDLRVVQSGTHIDVYAFEPPAMLVPSFDTDGVSVTANGVSQKDGTTSIALTGTVTYIVMGADHGTVVYTVTMHAASWVRFNSSLDKSNSPVGMAVGDLDDDGYPDVVVGDITPTLYVYRNTSGSGTPSFAKIGTIPAPFVAQAIVIADLDGDGHQDIAIGGFAGSSVAVFLNQGGDIFSPAKPFTAIQQTTSLVASKITSNLVPDLLTTTGSGNAVALLANTTTGPGSVAFAPAKGYGNPMTDQDTVSLAVLDWNDDQKPDLAVAAANGGIVRILSGANGFTSIEERGQLATPSWIATGDLDGDGKLDLAIATAGAPSIQLVPHGDLSGGTKAMTVGLPTCVGIADLDGDGLGDLVATSRESTTSGYVETLIVGPSGDSRDLDRDPVDGSTFGCAIVDIDHDGAPDVVTVSGSAIRGSVLRR